jgi:hypothetical protein
MLSKSNSKHKEGEIRKDKSTKRILSEKEKEERKNKPKPIMVDAWTQTKRSDYRFLKERMMMS